MRTEHKADQKAPVSVDDYARLVNTLLVELNVAAGVGVVVNHNRGMVGVNAMRGDTLIEFGVGKTEEAATRDLIVRLAVRGARK